MGESGKINPRSLPTAHLRNAPLPSRLRRATFPEGEGFAEGGIQMNEKDTTQAVAKHSERNHSKTMKENVK